MCTFYFILLLVGRRKSTLASLIVTFLVGVPSAVKIEFLQNQVNRCCNFYGLIIEINDGTEMSNDKFFYRMWKNETARIPNFKVTARNHVFRLKKPSFLSEYNRNFSFKVVIINWTLLFRSLDSLCRQYSKFIINIFVIIVTIFRFQSLVNCLFFSIAFNLHLYVQFWIHFTGSKMHSMMNTFICNIHILVSHEQNYRWILYLFSNFRTLCGDSHW